MIKRLVFIALFTGSGQLLSLLILKFISRNGNTQQIADLAQADTLYLLIVNMIAMGLQSATMRNITLAGDWKPEFERTQSARLGLGILMLPLAALSFFYPSYLFFLLAPVFALSGDYALYALGKPVIASGLAFLRTLLPYLMVVIAAWLSPGLISLSFLAGVALVYLLSNIFISKYLSVPLLPLLNWKDLILYLKSLPLGIVNLSMYFIGPGLLIIVPWFYPSSTMAVAFVGLKFYFIFKGVLRIIHQSFFKDMVREEVCLRLDQLSMMVAFIFLLSAIVFPKTFISIFFGDMFWDNSRFFSLLAVSALVYSFMNSQTTVSMLKKKDRLYCIMAALSCFVTILSVAFLSLISFEADTFAVGLLIGEVAFMIGLYKLNGEMIFLYERFAFMVKCTLIGVWPVAVYWILGDTFFSYILGIAGFTLLLLFFYAKVFLTLKVSKN